MRSTIRYAVAWGPLALSVKNWVIDIRPIDGSVSLHHGRGLRVNGGTDWVVVQKYRIQVLRQFTRGEIIYLKSDFPRSGKEASCRGRSPERPGAYWVRRLVGLEGDVVTPPESDHGETVPQVTTKRVRRKDRSVGSLLGGALRRGLGQFLLCCAAGVGRGLHYAHPLAAFTSRCRTDASPTYTDRH